MDLYLYYLTKEWSFKLRITLVTNGISKSTYRYTNTKKPVKELRTLLCT